MRLSENDCLKGKFMKIWPKLWIFTNGQFLSMSGFFYSDLMYNIWCMVLTIFSCVKSLAILNEPRLPVLGTHWEMANMLITRSCWMKDMCRDIDFDNWHALTRQDMAETRQVYSTILVCRIDENVKCVLALWTSYSFRQVQN